MLFKRVVVALSLAGLTCSGSAQQLLQDGGFDERLLTEGVDLLADSSFELSVNNGSYPFSTNWTGAWIGDGGGIVVNSGARSGLNGLWQFTGAGANNWWSAIFQDRLATPGMAFSASTWARTPPNEPWAQGSEAYLHIAFLSPAGHVIGSVRSAGFSGPNTNWTRLELTTPPAPTNTVQVRFTVYLRKPQGVGVQSIVNFDDCALLGVERAQGRISSRALGVPYDSNQVAVELRNVGRAPLGWQVLENVPWLSAGVASGEIAPQDAREIVFNVNRAALPGTGTVKASVVIMAGAEAIGLDLYVEVPSPAPPSQPSEVKVIGRQLRVRDRLPDGSLSDAYHYVIRGAAWSPASIGTISNPESRREEFAKWYVADVQLMRAMNANTVYVFLDFGTGDEGLRVLDYLYHNGLKAIVTTDGDGTADSNRVHQVVTAYRNHPAILAWAIGNEWNINLYHHAFATLGEAAQATEALARLAKELDSHPVVATYGDIDIPGLNPLRKSDENPSQPISTERIVNDICPSVDFWGLNIYRGASFGNVFEQWTSISDKPMYSSEYGTDAYRIFVLNLLDGAEDEATQAAFNRGLWHEIAANLSALHLTKSCLGGTVFAWNDEWWKAREEHGASPLVQDNLGFGGGHPDGFANEEWFGIVAIDRRVRQSYFNFQSDFAAVNVPADLDQDGLPDAWEYDVIDGSSMALRFLTDLNPQDDFDGDGANNRTEYGADTDALDPASLLRLTGIVKENQNVRVSWSGGTEATQFLEVHSAVGMGGAWTTIFTNHPPTPVANQFIEMIGGQNQRQYYRVRAQRD